MPKDLDPKLFSEDDPDAPYTQTGDPEPSEDTASGVEPTAEETVKVSYSGPGGDVAIVSVGGYDIDFSGGDQTVPKDVGESAAETFDTVEVV